MNITLIQLLRFYLVLLNITQLLKLLEKPLHATNPMVKNIAHKKHSNC